MSYILDALRRADAERERGAVPSLHTQQYGALPGDEDDASRRSQLPTIVAAVLAIVLLAAIGWYVFGGSAQPRAVAPVVVAPPPPIATVPTSTAPAASAAAIGDATARPTAASSPARREAVRAAGATRAAPATAAASTSERIGTIADLPDDVRRGLPKLAFGGASYSSDPASRMVILNGQVFHEGDSVAPGLVLQRVNRKSAVLAVRGSRFELAF